MKSRIRKVGSISGFLLSVFFPVLVHAQFWEIPDPEFPYIAMIRADPQWGSAVVYNPGYCELIGEACAFFRAHEYAHAALNHVFLPPDAYPVSIEREADCWAAKYISPQEALAAARLFEESGGRKDLPLFGDPAQRARTIRECAY